jgi:hypothetical protein
MIERKVFGNGGASERLEGVVERATNTTSNRGDGARDWSGRGWG